MSTNNLQLKISTIKHIKDTAPRVVSATWEQLCRKLQAHTAYDSKEDAPLWCPTEWKEGRPREMMNLEKGNLEAVYCFVADFDDGVKPSDLMDRWVTKGKEQLAYMVYSSYNHTADAPRWRLVIPLAQPVPAEEWKTDVWPRLSYHLCNYHNDGQAKDAARYYYFPSCPKEPEDRIEQAFCDRMSGVALDVSTVPPVPEKVYAKRAYTKAEGSGTGRPGDDFNEKATAEDTLAILLRAGCRELSRSGDVISVIRPNKPFDIRSGTIGHVAPNVYFNFSDSFPPLLPYKAYRPFDLFGLLECGGDFKAAAKQKAAEGFGEPIKSVELKFDGKTVKVRETPRRKPGPDVEGDAWEDGADEPETLPTVVMTNRPDRAIAADCWDAVFAANEPPKLYNRNKGVARIALNAETQTMAIDRVDEQTMLFRLRRVADYVSLKKIFDSDLYQQTHVPPPERIAKDMLRDLDRIAALPPLHSVYYAPIVDVTGNLLTRPGYYRNMALYLATERIGDCKPHGDTKADALAALDRLFGKEGVFGEFPFVNVSARAHAIAFLLTPFLRPYIDHCSPLFLVEAPEAGTGKSLLARNVIRLVDASPKAWDAPAARENTDAEAEWNKILAMALQNQPPTLFFDNIRGLLASTALEGIITSPDPTALRLLGTSTEVTVFPRLLTIVATSNNAEAHRDMTRRSVSIRIDAQMGTPDERSGFRIPDLDEHIKSNRAQILSDVMTILAAWIKAGRPEQTDRVKGSFERWARIVGGALAFLGVEGFLADDKERALMMDPQAEQWAAFLEAWAVKGYHERGVDYPPLGDGWLACGDILPCAVAKGVLHHGATSKGLGHALKRNRDRVFGEYRLLMRYDTDAKTNKYRVSSTRGDGLFRFDSTGLPGINGDSALNTHDPLSDPVTPRNQQPLNGSLRQRGETPENPIIPVTSEPAKSRALDWSEPDPDPVDDDFGSEAVPAFSLRIEWKAFDLGRGNMEYHAVMVVNGGKLVGKGPNPLEALRELTNRLNDLSPSRERMQALDLVNAEYNGRKAKEEGK